jgi:Na+-transporting NADH:ubiquinone oxidoreductase subunit NqrC
MKNIWIILLVVFFLCSLCAVVLGGVYYFLSYRPAQSQLLIQPLMINAGDIPSDWPDDHYGSTPIRRVQMRRLM